MFDEIKKNAVAWAEYEFIGADDSENPAILYSVDGKNEKSIYLVDGQEDTTEEYWDDCDIFQTFADATAKKGGYFRCMKGDGKGRVVTGYEQRFFAADKQEAIDLYEVWLNDGNEDRAEDFEILCTED
jgi:hypothetical protein